MKEAILSVLLSLPVPRDGEPADARAERLVTIAEAITSATNEATCSGAWSRSDWCRTVWGGTRAELAALLIVQAYRESGLALRVHAGDCLPTECDARRLPGGGIEHQAVGLWQLHRSAYVPEPLWRELAGVEPVPTFLAARSAARILASGRAWCARSGGDPLEATLSAYATGGRCSWVGAPRRAAMARRFMTKL